MKNSEMSSRLQAIEKYRVTKKRESVKSNEVSMEEKRILDNMIMSGGNDMIFHFSFHISRFCCKLLN